MLTNALSHERLTHLNSVIANSDFLQTDFDQIFPNF